MKKETLKNFGIDLVVDIIGSILIAIGTYNFATAQMFPLSGITGLAIVFYHLFGLPIGLLTIAFNIPIALICAKRLGKDFLFKSIKTMVISSLFIDYVAPLFPVYTGDKLLAVICTAVISAIGYALIFARNSSTGGADFIVLALKDANPHLSLGTISFSFEIFVILIGTVLVSKDIDNFIYGMLICYISSTVLDKFMYGLSSGKLTLIVTDKPYETSEMISETTGRGSTILYGEGSYSKEKRSVVMSACTKKQMYKISREIKDVDPDSFLVIMESNEVHGKGFMDHK